MNIAINKSVASKAQIIFVGLETLRGRGRVCAMNEDDDDGGRR